MDREWPYWLILILRYLPFCWTRKCSVYYTQQFHSSICKIAEELWKCEQRVYSPLRLHLTSFITINKCDSKQLVNSLIVIYETAMFLYRFSFNLWGIFCLGCIFDCLINILKAPYILRFAIQFLTYILFALLYFCSKIFPN